jgi:hypothetical protein
MPDGRRIQDVTESESEYALTESRFESVEKEGQPDLPYFPF